MIIRMHLSSKLEAFWIKYLWLSAASSLRLNLCSAATPMLLAFPHNIQPPTSDAVKRGTNTM